MNQAAVIRGIEQRYREISGPLNERQRRHWAAAEALQLGRGGITVVSRALHMSRNTIRKGILELETGQANVAPNSRIRRPGGGRKLQNAKSALPSPCSSESSSG
jgi:hypothetical protein